MRNALYRIAAITASRTAHENRYSFLKALAAEGNEVMVIDVRHERLRERLADYRPSFLLMFCVDYAVLVKEKKSDILSSFSYVTLWDSNPLRALYYLQHHRCNHLALFAIDTAVVQELRLLGFDQSAYFPYYYTDPAVFTPLPCDQRYRHDVSFAGTFVAPSTIRKFIGDHSVPWTQEMEEAWTDFQTQRAESAAYIDVYGFLRGRMDIWSREFAKCSTYLMHAQKWLERMHLFRALATDGIDIHVYGGFQRCYTHPGMNSGGMSGSDNVHLHDFLDKHSELPKLYASTAVNLCCTQFPRACHERVFQTAACGAFLLHEKKDDVPLLFEPDKEIVLYESPEELPSLIRYYLSRPAERESIAHAARRRFLAEHTPAQRARKFLRLMKDKVAERAVPAG
ncbi:MAG: glycosyltransferase [Thermodesulfovibrionales bacterium]